MALLFMGGARRFLGPPGAEAVFLNAAAPFYVANRWDRRKWLLDGREEVPGAHERWREMRIVGATDGDLLGLLLGK